MSKRNTPIIVGVSQFTQFKEVSARLDPLNLMVKTSREAFANAGTNDLINFIDSIYIINIQSWSYADVPGELAQALGMAPINKVYSPDSGNMPQKLVSRAAKAIILGESQGILIAGGEAAYTKSLNKRKVPNWPRSKKPKYMEGDTLKNTYESNDIEYKYRLLIPATVYAVIETALRASLGRSVDEHNQHIGKLFEHVSMIASKNPYSWVKKHYNAKDIITPTSENRYINHPYTKRMCANMFVDQSSALIMTSEEIAEKLGIDKKHWVYLMGYADLNNIFTLTERPKLYDSPAAREGSRLALKQAGLELKDIDAFDLYCCFPIMLEILMNEIGLSEDDSRDLTLTGGLPFFGGPWSSYSLHGIVSAVERIHECPSQKIMVAANGGFNSKISIGIYGSKPPATPLSERDDTIIQEAIFSEALPEPIKEASGLLTIEAYTFNFKRDGQILNGIVVAHLENGRRTMAEFEAEQEVLENLEKQELIGRTFKVEHDSIRKLNLIKI